jgi:hypothetical protein
MQNFLELAAALTLGHGLHVFIEIWAAQGKLKRLETVLGGGLFKPYRLHIDTRVKVYALHMSIFLALSLGSYVLLWALALSPETLTLIIIIAVILSELVYTDRFDRHHSLMQRILRTFGKP